MKMLLAQKFGSRIGRSVLLKGANQASELFRGSRRHVELSPRLHDAMLRPA